MTTPPLPNAFFPAGGPAGRPAEQYEMVVYGLPVGQGHKRGFYNKHIGRVQLVESNAGHKDWRTLVSSMAQDVWGDRPLLDGPLWITLHFALPKPKSAPKRRRTWPIGKNSGDLDTLARAVGDSLTSRWITDDSRFVKMTVTKDYGERPGVTITVGRVTETVT